MPIREIKPNVYSVGAIDWSRKVFDNLIPLPDGTSYNSYLIKGSEKTALVDTVYPPKQDELIANLASLGIKKLDYIVANHAEQDHSGSIPKLLELFPEAKVITNGKCKGLLVDLLLVQEDKIVEIKDNETLSLGDKTLKFMIAPWVHWPDTMFTLLEEDNILFTCDFFGSHIATSSLYVDHDCNVYDSAKRYYAEIMMPFRANIRKHLERIKDLGVEMYAPSHGPIYKNTEFIFNAYQDWVSDEVKNKVVIPYISMYESTTKMVDYLADKLIQGGVKVNIFDLTDVDTGKLAMELVDAATLVVSTSMVLAGPHPKAVYAAFLANAIRPKVKFVSVIGSYGWAAALAPKMAEQIRDLIPNIKAEILEPVFIKGQPSADDLKALDILAHEIIKKHKEIGV